MSETFVLVVDDEPDIRELVSEILEDEGYRVATAQNGAEAREVRQQRTPDLVLLDIWMPDVDGISLLKEWRDNDQLHFPVVMMSGHGTVETAVEATRLGAIDFVEKPLSLSRLLMTIEKAQTSWRAEGGGPSVAAQEKSVIPELVGGSSYARQLRSQIERVGNNDAAVLITGPHGSGKSLIAQHVHAIGQRQGRALVCCRAEAIGEETAAVELYGSEYEGSVSTGFLERAQGGVLLLNDVGDLSQSAQKYLLAALDAGRFMRVGGSASLNLDVRVMATSAEDLSALVEAGAFSQELYYRLNVLPLQTQPLADHKEDIPALLEYFVNWFTEQEGLGYRHFNVSAQNSVRNHDWSGDIRELRNFVQRLMILGSGKEVSSEEVNEAIQSRVESKTVPLVGETMMVPLELPLREARAEFERVYLTRQLEKVNGRIGELAQRVGMERTHLYRKLRSLGIDSKNK